MSNRTANENGQRKNDQDRPGKGKGKSGRKKNRNDRKEGRNVGEKKVGNNTEILKNEFDLNHRKHANKEQNKRAATGKHTAPHAPPLEPPDDAHPDDAHPDDAHDPPHDHDPPPVVRVEDELKPFEDDQKSPKKGGRNRKEKKKSREEQQGKEIQLKVMNGESHEKDLKQAAKRALFYNKKSKGKVKGRHTEEKDAAKGKGVEKRRRYLPALYLNTLTLPLPLTPTGIQGARGLCEGTTSSSRNAGTKRVLGPGVALWSRSRRTSRNV